MKYEIQQNDAINILKGFGILLVVIGHFNFDRNLDAVIYSFHMPLFFFISGYLFTPGSSWRVFLKKKSRRLLLPYFVYLFLISLLSYILFPNPIESWSILVIKLLFGGRLLIRYFGVFWFITCLFATQCLVRYIIVNKLSRGIVFVVLISLSSIHSVYYHKLYLPWAIDIVPMSSIIFLSGFYYREYRIKVNNLLLIFFLIVNSILVTQFTTAEIDMKYAIYGIPIVSTFGSLVMVLACFRLSESVLTQIRLGDFLIFLGQRSLLIMYLHLPIKYALLNVDGLDVRMIFIFAIVAPCFLYNLFESNKYTSLCLLGK